MANDEHNTPAPAGNSERAVRLIAEALDDAKSLTAGLEQLHAFPDKAKLGNQLIFIMSLAFHSGDAQTYMEVVLENVSRGLQGDMRKLRPAGFSSPVFPFKRPMQNRASRQCLETMRQAVDQDRQICEAAGLEISGNEGVWWHPITDPAK